MGVRNALRRLISGPAHPEFQRAATRANLLRARSILTPREQLIKLLSSNDGRIVAEAVETFYAGSHILSADEQIALATTPHSLTHQLILKQTEVTEGALKILMEKPDRLIRDPALERFLRHKGYEGLGDLGKALSELDCPEFTRAVARSYYATLDTLNIIARGPDTEAAETATTRIEREFLPEIGGWFHGRKILKRNGISSSTLVRLIVASSSKRIAARALTELIIKEPIDEATLIEISNSPHKRIREYIVNNPLTPQSVLGEYLKDPALAFQAFKNLENRALITDDLFGSLYESHKLNPEWIRLIANSRSCPRDTLIRILSRADKEAVDLAYDNIVERDLAGPDIALTILGHYEWLRGETPAMERALRRMFLTEAFIDKDTPVSAEVKGMFLPWAGSPWLAEIFEINNKNKIAALQVPTHFDRSPTPLVVIEISPSGCFRFKWVRQVEFDGRWNYDKSKKNFKGDLNFEYNPRNDTYNMYFSSYSRYYIYFYLAIEDGRIIKVKRHPSS